VWVKDWIGRRDTAGTHQALLKKELQCEGMRYYVKYVRMGYVFQFKA
jgi:hypothetical protein